jgi:hypothetical protein
MEKKQKNQDAKNPEKEQLPGNPVYSEEDDIYNRAKKAPLEEDELPVKGQKKHEPSLDDDLDIPGAELDDADEELGEEDEENNYYSLGGDNHSDLDEN